MDELLKSLDEFLANNPDLEQLSAQLATFDIFRTLKIEKTEIRHSNVLAWLLDPTESHGLGDIFLRRFLSNLILGSPMALGISAADVELREFHRVEVYRERQHIDVLVIDREAKLLLLIENKTESDEGPGQLVRYYKSAKEEFTDFVVIPVFLTLDGHPSDDEEANDFIPYSHASLVEVLERILEQRSDQMTKPVQTFLTHYMDALRRLTMSNDKLVELCQRIYRKHKMAIDAINEYGKSNIFSEIAAEIIKQKDYEVLYPATNYLWFMPKTWARLIPENGTAWQNLSRPVSVACWIELWQDRVSLVFEVSRMKDKALRLQCVKKLQEAGFKLSKMAFKEDATYSRFFRASYSVENANSEEELRRAVEEVIRKSDDQFPKAEKVFREVFGVAAE